jgi:hypothetical protein
MVPTELFEPRLGAAHAPGVSPLPPELPVWVAVLDLDFSAGEPELWRAVAAAGRRQE